MELLSGTGPGEEAGDRLERWKKERKWPENWE
jgi:hypothetical protein